ncbi:MAG: hypothetical protein JSW62_00835 [Thermoplasmatales archaeon]|nr:MAG: hypothetical protein JSW62_00835 [Thermoplasmatales archaeon]
MSLIPILDGVTNLIDRLIQLLLVRKARRKEVFDQCLKPLFMDLEKVHTDYLTSFGEALNLVQQPDYFDKIIDHICERRLPLLPIRQKLRGFLEELDHEQLPREERDFYSAMSNYIGVQVPWYSEFSNCGLAMVMLEKKMACGVKLPIENYQDAYRYVNIELQEPSFESYAVLRFLKTVDDPIVRDVKSMVSSLITEQISRLNKRWHQVVQAYASLQFEVAKL